MSNNLKEKMRLIIILLAITILGFITINAHSQIVVKNVNSDKQIEIKSNDHIKLVFTTDKKFNGLYDFVIHGRNKNFKTGKLKSYNDNFIVVQSGMFGKLDTIQINDIHMLNKYNPYIRATAIILTSTGVLLVLTSTAIVNSPYLLGYALVGIWGISLIDDLVIYPHKNIRLDKWIIEFK
jgi:hypothetical protein